MPHIEISNKIKLTLIVSVVFLLIVLAATFVNMRRSISESKKETMILNIVKNIEEVHGNIDRLENIKEQYLQTGNDNLLIEYNEILIELKTQKNSLLTYSIENNFEKDGILLLANTLNSNITKTNELLDGKKYGVGGNADSLFAYSKEILVNTTIQQAIQLQKKSIDTLKAATTERENRTSYLLWLFIVIAFLFFGSMVLTYIYLLGDLKKSRIVNKVLLHNSTLLKNIYDSIITTDNNFVVIDWNEYAKKLYGYAVEEAIGKSIIDLLKLEATTIKDKYPGFFSNETWKGEMLHYHKNGTPLFVDVSRTDIKDAAQKNSGCIYVARNISERVELEKNLKNLSENLQEQVNVKVSELNNFFERITDAFVAFDNDWNYTYLNKAALQLHGVAEADIVGKNIWDTYPDLVKEPFYETLQLAQKTQQPQRCELYYSAKDKWFADLIYPSENGVSVYYNDITDKKKAEIELSIAQNELVDAEGKFRALVEKSMVGVYIRKNRRLLYVNPQFAKIFGYTEDQLYNDLNNLNLIAADDKKNVKEILYRYKKNNTTSYHYEFVGVHKTGKKIYIEVYGSLTKYKGKDAVIGTIIDITERRTASMQLALSEEALKFSNERFELVAQATKDGIWDWDIENDELNGNAIFCSMLGLNENQKSNYEHFFEKVHADDKDKLLENFNTAVAKNETLLTEEFRLIDEQGNYRMIYDRAYILYKDKIAYRILGAMQDITAMKETESKLLLEKKLSDSIINSLPGIFYLFNKEGRFLKWNKNFETVTGYTTEEVKEIQLLSLFEDIDQEKVTEKVQSVFFKGYDMVEVNFKIKNGTLIPYYFTGKYIRYENEDCLLGVGLDISEKIKSQNELIESEQKFRTLVQQASDGIIVTNEDGDFIDVNDSAASLTGYKKQELENLNTNDIFFEEGSIKRPMHYNAMANGAVVISEHIIKRKGGKLINVEVSAKQLSDGRFQRILRDITERTQVEDALRSSEKKYRLLFNDNPLPMWITSITDNKFIDVNNAALESYGYTKEVFLKMKLSDLDAPEKDDVLRAEHIFEHIKKDGSKIKVDINTHDIIYEGKPAVLSLANDITAKFEAEESLQKSNEALKELASHLETIRENERSHMAREIHDELGQQLTGLKMDISWLNRKIKSDDEAVKEKMKDTIALINKTVIAVRRIATQLRPSILDDLGLIAAMEWQSEEFEKRAEIKSVFNSNVRHVKVSTDIATAVFRIFQESLTNVLRHAKATKVVSFFRLDEDNITLFIEDNGIGFKEEEIKNKKTLGLLGMKERIQLINGRYEINGNTGKGTSVIITVPLK